MSVVLDSSAMLNNGFGHPLMTDGTKFRKGLETSIDIVAERPGKGAESLSRSECIAKRK